MRLSIDPEDPHPLNSQIERAIEKMIREGALSPGSKLPSTRTLALDSGCSRTTTESAYAILESRGLIERRAGAGTFVARGETAAARDNASIPLPAWQRRIKANGTNPDFTRGLGLGLDGGRGIIDLSSGAGDPDLHPVADVREAARTVLARHGRDALGYSDPRGIEALRAQVARVLSSRGTMASPDEILVTSGSQEALALSALALSKPGMAAVVPVPCYAAALALFRTIGLAPRGVPTGENGYDLDALDKALQAGDAAFIYVMPNFANPTGLRLDAPTRRSLAELAARHDVPMLEDDFVGDLAYEGRDLPSLFALSGSITIHTATFSKMLAPGLRVGFLAARGPVLDRLAEIKYCLSLSAPRLSQEIMARTLSVGRYDAHVRKARKLYRSRRDAMVAALERVSAFRFSVPQGGLFAWVRLPAGMDSGRVTAEAASRGVLVYDGAPCFPDPTHPDSSSYLRLNFASSPAESIEVGIGRLSEVLKNIP